MLPVVDSNWHVEKRATSVVADLSTLAGRSSRDYHVLRAVVVQQAQTHAESLADLALWSKRARTPGSGGLPNAIVPYCDLAATDVLKQLTMLAANDSVRGVSYGLKQTDIAPLQDALGFLAQHHLSLDLTCDCTLLPPVLAIANHYPALTLVLNASKLHPDGKSPGFDQWSSSITDCADYPNIFIKITGYSIEGADCMATALDSALQFLKQAIGTGRIILAGEAENVDQSAVTSMWSRYANATRWASASERDKLFRRNAMRVYRLS